MNFSEADVATRVKNWLTHCGWDVYAEVEFFGGGERADLVAVRQRLTWIIEVKTSLSLALLNQAMQWSKRGCTHHISVAVPKRGVSEFVSMGCKNAGIGILHVEMMQYRDDVPVVTEELKARLHRVDRAWYRRMLDKLHPDMKAVTPGTQGGYSTPFSRTMRDVVAYVRRNPGCGIKDIVNEVKYHYQSRGTATRCIPQWLREERYPVSVETDGRKLRFYPLEEWNP